MTPAQQRQICEWFAAIGGGDKDAKKNIKALIAKLKKSWNDLPDIVQPSGAPRSGLAPWMAAPGARARKRGEQRNTIRARFGSMGSNYENESDNAEKALKTYLMQVGLMWDDLPWLVQPDPDPKQASTSTSTSAPMEHPFTAPDAPPPCAVLARLIKKYVAATSHQALAAALWAMHTQIYRRYLITPRLFINSPVHHCGKSTLMRVLARLVVRPSMHDNITTAALYRAIDEDGDSTFLLDEGENLNGQDMRYVLNGNHADAKVTRTIQGQAKDFSAFTTIAFAAIGTAAFHVSTLSRSIKITLQRRRRGDKLRRYDQNDTRDLDMAHAYVCEWIEREQENISYDPPMPEIDARVLDNWRPLVAIADASGMGEQARAAMLALSADSESSINVTALEHIRIVFDRAGNDLIVDTASGEDVIPTSKLLSQMHTLDVADGRWQHYRGPNGTTAPRRLTDRALADLLKPFEIGPDLYRPRGGGKQFRGYARANFTAAWEAYCPRDEQPTAPLRLVVSRDDDDVA